MQALIAYAVLLTATLAKPSFWCRLYVYKKEFQVLARESMPLTLLHLPGAPSSACATQVELYPASDCMWPALAVCMTAA